MIDDHLTELAFVANLEKATPGLDSVLISNRVLQGSVAAIARLNAELTEAREIIAIFLEDYPEDEEAEIQSGVARALGVEDASTLDVTHPAVRRARAFLTKGETDDA